MVDTSLSMAGEKMALAAVAAAVLALKLRPGDLAVVLFADGARAVLRFGEEVAPAELVRRMLAVPCGGGTDIAAALRLGHAELQRGRDPSRSGLLVSDGVYTSGADPLPAAARFGPLHVLLMEEQAGGPRPGRAGHHLDLAPPAGRRGHRPRRRRRPRPRRRLPGAAAPHARGRRPGAALRDRPAGETPVSTGTGGGRLRARARGRRERRRGAAAGPGRHRGVGALEVPLRLRGGGPLPDLPAALAHAASRPAASSTSTRRSCCCASTSARTARSG